MPILEKLFASPPGGAPAPTEDAQGSAVSRVPDPDVRLGGLGRERQLRRELGPLVDTEATGDESESDGEISFMNGTPLDEVSS